MFTGPNISTDGLVLVLDAANTKSYPGSGTTWTNMVGTVNGVLTNGPVFNSNNAGYFIFDGTNDFCRFVYSWPTIFTLNLWVYPIAAPGGVYSRILSTGDTFFFELAYNSSRQLSYYPKDSVLIGTSWASNVLTLDNNWNNICFIRNSGTALIYKNGVLEYTGTSYVASNGSTLYLGTTYSGTEPTNMNLSNFQVYNRALTSSEIQQNYNAQKSRFNL